MINILDRVAPTNPHTKYARFEPDTVRDVFALALARRLNDAVAAPYYARLCQQYSPEQLVHVYRRSLETRSERPLHQVFHENIKTLQSGSSSNGRTRLAAVRIERRAVAIAIMHGEDAEWTRVRQLSSAFDKAQDSATFFVSKTLALYPFKSAVLEIIPNGHEFHRSRLTQLIKSLLRDRAVSITEVHKRSVFENFGYPPKRSRKEVRAAIERIYPFEAFSGYGAPFVQDALALGLHDQTERQFRN